MSDKIILATRRSPLALAQTELVRAHLAEHLPDATFEVLKLVTRGDEGHSLSSMDPSGVKGLFTREIESALLEGKAHVAVHSAKDLPIESGTDLKIAGYLPRQSAHDVLVVREDCAKPGFIATGSPRRRLQAKALFPKAVWSQMRGNVETRLKKIERGEAEATIVAAAGLKRLGISQWTGLTFKPLDIRQMVPAPGQGAIALQCRRSDVEHYAEYLDEETAFAVNIERAFARLTGVGCHSAGAVHYCNDELHVFLEEQGYKKFSLKGVSEKAVEDRLAEIVKENGLGADQKAEVKSRKAEVKKSIVGRRKAEGGRG